jgi:hypothetical protein
VAGAESTRYHRWRAVATFAAGPTSFVGFAAGVDLDWPGDIAIACCGDDPADQREESWLEILTAFERLRDSQIGPVWMLMDARDERVGDFGTQTLPARAGVMSQRVALAGWRYLGKHLTTDLWVSLRRFWVDCQDRCLVRFRVTRYGSGRVARALSDLSRHRRAPAWRTMLA